jgi:DNA-binding MarR family transcriptional regulator
MMTKMEEGAIKDLGIEFSSAVIFMHEAIAQKAGLSGTDHKYLGIIIKNKQMTAGELAEATGLTTGAVTGLIDRLEKKKLVKRQFDKTDRRKVKIIPNTENVQKVLAPNFEYLQQATVRLIASFSREEIKAIEKYFHLAIAMMKDVKIKLQKK